MAENDNITGITDNLESHPVEQEEQPTERVLSDTPIESVDDIDDFDLEALIVAGTDAIIDEVIEYYSTTLKATRKMTIYIRPMSHYDWDRAAKAASRKNSDKNIEETICSQCLLYKNGNPIELSKIREMEKGVISQAYQKIKIISGQTVDPLEDKLLERMADF